MDTRIKIDFERSTESYDVVIGPETLENAGDWAADVVIGSSRKLAVISNGKVFGLYGKTLIESLGRAGFDVKVFLIGDGERFKNLRTVERTLAFLSDSGIKRSDAVIALGGGVVGDLAGFAASVYLRGISFLLIPTTLLSMIDSSVGGKTGVNTTFGKNLVGTFYQPDGVLIDPLILRTLPSREITAGLYEAIKQGAVGGRELFDNVSDFLNAYNTTRKPVDNTSIFEAFEHLIARQVDFKASIVRRDERENPENTSVFSRKILNFGHTLAHALENVTRYRYLKHGEAVGYGVLFSVSLSKKLELLDEHDVELLNDVMHRAGALPAIAHLDPHTILESFKYDKKIVGDSLQWILLRGIGEPVIVPSADIPHTILKSSLAELIGR